MYDTTLPSISNQPSKTSEDSVFERSLYFLKRTTNALKGEIRYHICDADENVILNVHRPTHFWRTLISLIAGTSLMVILMILSVTIEEPIRPIVSTSWSVVVMLAGFVVALVAGGLLYKWTVPKITYDFYRADNQHDLLLRIIQKTSALYVYATFHVLDRQGNILNIILKDRIEAGPKVHWYILDPQWNRLYEIFEDSRSIGMLRRAIHLPYSLFSKTNFAICDSTTFSTQAEFRRRERLHGMTTLECADDQDAPIDPRSALAIAVLLDNE